MGVRVMVRSGIGLRAGLGFVLGLGLGLGVHVCAWVHVCRCVPIAGRFLYVHVCASCSKEKARARDAVVTQLTTLMEEKAKMEVLYGWVYVRVCVCW